MASLWAIRDLQILVHVADVYCYMWLGCLFTGLVYGACLFTDFGPKMLAALHSHSFTLKRLEVAHRPRVSVIVCSLWLSGYFNHYETLGVTGTDGTVPFGKTSHFSSLNMSENIRESVHSFVIDLMVGSRHEPVSPTWEPCDPLPMISSWFSYLKHVTYETQLP